MSEFFDQPKKALMRRSFQPRLARSVAAEWRNRCGWTSLESFAFLPASLQNFQRAPGVMRAWGARRLSLKNKGALGLVLSGGASYHAWRYGVASKRRMRRTPVLRPRVRAPSVLRGRKRTST